MGLRERLKALEQLAEARLPQSQRPNLTDDDLRAWADDARQRLGAGEVPEHELDETRTLIQWIEHL